MREEREAAAAAVAAHVLEFIDEYMRVLGTQARARGGGGVAISRQRLGRAQQKIEHVEGVLLPRDGEGREIDGEGRERAETKRR